jgi:hypothetical protein
LTASPLQHHPIGEIMSTSPLVTGSFWRQAAERAAKTFGQALAATWAAGAGLDLFAIDWSGSLGVAGAAALLSLATSLGSAPIGPSKGSPSLVEVEPTPPARPDWDR